MFDQALLALTWRVIRRRLFASLLAPASAVAFPAFVVWIGVTDSYGTAARFFFFLLPHVFLIASQDVVRTDLDSGVLENVLFIGGRFRGFLAAKTVVLSTACAVYAAVLFGLFAAWGVAAGGFEPVFAVRFGLALLAGVYYIALAGALSHWLKSGSNVVALLLAQAAALGLLIASASARTGLLDYAAGNQFPGLGPKLKFGALVAVLPNLVVSGRLPAFAAEVLAGLALAVIVQGRLIRRFEIGRGGSGA
jgi:hypothetical protein